MPSQVEAQGNVTISKWKMMQNCGFCCEQVKSENSFSAAQLSIRDYICTGANFYLTVQAERTIVLSQCFLLPPMVCSLHLVMYFDNLNQLHLLRNLHLRIYHRGKITIPEMLHDFQCQKFSCNVQWNSTFTSNIITLVNHFDIYTSNFPFLKVRTKMLNVSELQMIILQNYDCFAVDWWDIIYKM